MKICSCATVDASTAQTSKLRKQDELGRPAEESLVRGPGRRLLRPRVVILGDRVKVTVAEAADLSGDVRVDGQGAPLIYPGTVARLGEAARERAEPVLARATARAGWVAGLREAVEHRWEGRGSAPSARCETCGGEPHFLDCSAGAAKRGGNELVLRTPRGFYARVRATLLKSPARAGILPVHLTVAHAVDASGDVVRGEDGDHRIVDCGVHTLNLDRLEVDWQTGRPRSSLSAVLADLILTEGLTRLEGAILSRSVYERVPFLREATSESKPESPRP